ncbi:ribosome-associated factor Y [Variibacter gotjawalensis]|uniref:Ribosome hibernation promoting factor n=1 Tax=Variibacter gotjawalensis TaxID=1333996 RepID=A0A0S3PVE7_9BRAD|nr:ribosome-associated translation inhibitor RaiA [Variibacter gotjawalensis]NIK50102.1 ribosomal subunit interface protein [Variibacter gotjawalensis]RZS46101.1 ribosomal subunit interface protein [Variibacter gotjawalensis]BAT59776.1 ribosome-associated factor Y [Variibacter gotjawalensis]
MSFRVSGKNLDIGEALRERVSARIAEAMEKHFQAGHTGHATVSRDGFGFRTECTIHLQSGITLEAEAMAADPYASADQAAERIEKRLRRYKRRLKDRSAQRANGHAATAEAINAATYVLAAPEHDDDETAVEFNPVVVAESTTALKLLPVSEAVLELDLTGAAVIVFRHAGNGRVNIVYRRPDGHIGWVDPPAMAVDAKH